MVPVHPFATSGNGESALLAVTFGGSIRLAA
jgi:hypothetical protein